MYKVLPVVAGVLLLFSSCTVHEEINLSEEGKGYYSMNMDMSPAMEMMKSMGSAGQIPDSIADKKIDSSFSMRLQIDSIDMGFTDTEKSFFYLGTTHMQMNMKEGKLMIDMKYPVANAGELQQFFTISKLVDSVAKEKKNDISDSIGTGAFAQPSADKMLSAFGSKGRPYIVTDSSIERTSVSKEELSEQLGSDMKGADMFMNQMSYTITVKLPKPVKKLDGKNVKLLDDKKTVVFSALFSELISDEGAGRFKIIF